MLHTPVSVARAAEPLELAHPELSKHALVLHRAPGEKEYREVPFRRAARHYRAVIDAGAANAGGLSYAIEIELADGSRIPAFASRSEPFDVQVQRSKADADELAAARRVHDHRSVASTRAEWANFGSGDEPLGKDNYYRVEASHAYRPLRFVNEFGVRLGLVRGTSPQLAEPLAGSDDTKEVGLNYAAPWVRLRLHDSAYLSGHLLTGVTEVDFSFGAGAALVLGDPYGAHLGLGVESIEGFGNRFFTRVNILVSERIALSPVIEATDMPNAGRYGVRCSPSSLLT